MGRLSVRPRTKDLKKEGIIHFTNKCLSPLRQYFMYGFIGASHNDRVSKAVQFEKSMVCFCPCIQIVPWTLEDLQDITYDGQWRWAGELYVISSVIQKLDCYTKENSIYNWKNHLSVCQNNCFTTSKTGLRPSVQLSLGEKLRRPSSFCGYL